MFNLRNYSSKAFKYTVRCNRKDFWVSPKRKHMICKERAYWNLTNAICYINIILSYEISQKKKVQTFNTGATHIMY